jgi:16S rRNA (uracil1498-N3)-methyltransferase
VSFRVVEKLPAPESGVTIILAAALIKFDRFELLVEKATELGVFTILPFEATRTERGLAQASVKRRERWERIALEASQQARRAQLPRLEPAVRFTQALQVDANTRFLLDESPDAPPILDVLPANRHPTDTVALLTGPEGGWTEEERQQAAAANWLPCSLAATILRAETAALVGLAIIQAAWLTFHVGQAPGLRAGP